MTIQEINNTYGRITDALGRKELKGAFDLLLGLIAGSGHYEFQDKLDELQGTYKAMLGYQMMNVSDPMQSQIYRQLQAALYELADHIRIRALEKDSPRQYFSMLRMRRMHSDASFRNLHRDLAATYDSLSPNAAEEWQKAQENRALTLFRKLWISAQLDVEEVVALRELLADERVPAGARCLAVSALWLSLQEIFDKEKVGLLCDAVAVANAEVHARALVSLLLTLYFYRKRTALYPQIEHRLQALAESLPGFSKEIQTIIMRFILSRETEKISRRLRDEIIPEMVKLGPKLSQKINLKDLTPEQLSDEMNPEWQEKLLADSDLGKKVMEFSELQQEGADIMHSTFVHLKNYPFFRETGNWFLLFDAKHSALAGMQAITENNVLAEVVNASSFMCNSDKYSLYLSMVSLPEQYRSVMAEQLSGQTAAMLEQKKSELRTKKDELREISGQYIQDLYRFYKLHPSHTDFDDIFTYPLDFHNLPILYPYISDPESLTAIAEYYLQKNYFADALTIFNRLEETDKANEILYQKIGYCKQMIDDVEGALAAYLQADLLRSDSKWVIRRIANCYRTLKQPEKALEYFHRYEMYDAENLAVQISIGHCHLELKEYDEALKYYYKVDYLDSGSHKAWRPIAWCSFLTGKFDQARNYYQKILEATPNTHDYLNAGHTEWVLQDIKGALKYYRQSVAAAEGNFEKFKEQFEQDIPDLENAGIESEEIPLLIDLLKYIVDGEIAY